MDIKLATLAGLSALFFLPQLASAGPLARTGRAIGNKSSGSKSGGSSSSGSSSSSNPTRDHPRDSRSHTHSRGNYSARSTTNVRSRSTRCDGCTTNSARPLRIPAPDLELALATQKVRDSDGSVRLSANMLWGRLGLRASGDYYFEQIAQAADAKSMTEARGEHVRVNLFELALLGRLLDTPRFQADIHAGLGVAASSLFETLPGTTVGISLQARASDALTLRAEGRSMALKYNTRVLEGATGVQWRELWLGYRALQFDVGELLQGPEVGLRFKF